MQFKRFPNVRVLPLASYTVGPFVARAFAVVRPSRYHAYPHAQPPSEAGLPKCWYVADALEAIRSEKAFGVQNCSAPAIFLDIEMHPDRWAATYAHELAHLIMYFVNRDTTEATANLLARTLLDLGLNIPTIPTPVDLEHP